MNKKCSQCDLINFATADACARCNAELSRVIHASSPKRSRAEWFFIRTGAVIMTIVVITIGFYLSLLMSAERLTPQQKETVRNAISILREKKFDSEVMMLSTFTAYRGNDNWLNASVAKENAYAATNFPFEIMTLYPDFFTYPIDDVEKAAILLHEARHLMGEGEKEAYAYVWKNRERLGWTEDKYSLSSVWINVRHQTREHVPELFNCAAKPLGDCTE
ncbi:hypothetical protein BH20ACI2_BH20ACI2_00330 [soil metagenome]